MATIATKTRVTLTLPAAEHIMKLGYWPEFRAMVEHTEETMPGLRSIHIWLDNQVKAEDPMVMIDVQVDDLRPRVPGMPDESPAWRWDGWAVETFSPDVLRHFCLMTWLEPETGERSNGR